MRTIDLPKRLTQIALSLMFCCSLLFVVLAAQIMAYSYEDSDGNADAAIVLGAAAWGNHPSPVYRERLNEAIRLYKEGRVGKLIFTGGTPNLAYPAESIVARDYAEAQGIPGRDILVDSKSRSTFENLLQARTLMKAAGIRSALLVSDPLHMRRAMYIAEKLEIDAKPDPSDTSRFQSFSSQSRFLWYETWAYAEQVIHVWTHSGPLSSPDPSAGRAEW